MRDTSRGHQEGLLGGFGGRLGGRLGRGLGGGLKKGLQRGLQTGFGWVLVVKLRSGLVRVWFSLLFKFNSLELDSEVGRLVIIIIIFRISLHMSKLMDLQRKFRAAGFSVSEEQLEQQKSKSKEQKKSKTKHLMVWSETSRE